MKSVLLAVLIVAVSLLMGLSSMFAHHSQSVYDTSREVVLTVTVTEIALVNPHTQIHYQVKDEAGNVEQWVAETAPPNNLRRKGWTKNTIKPGDQITLTVHTARDGSKVSHVLKIEANGKVLHGSNSTE